MTDYATARDALSAFLGIPVESAVDPCFVATWTVGGKRVRLASDGWTLRVVADRGRVLASAMGEATTPLPEVVAAVRAWVGIGAAE